MNWMDGVTKRNSGSHGGGRIIVFVCNYTTTVCTKSISTSPHQVELGYARKIPICMILYLTDYSKTSIFLL